MHVYFHKVLIAASAMLFIAESVVADPARDPAAIEAAAQAWVSAFNDRDIDRLTGLMTKDVVLLDPSVAPASGKAAREALSRAVSNARGKVMNASKDIEIAGEVAWRIGALTYQTSGGERIDGGQTLEVWRREQGVWKLHRQMSSNMFMQPKLLHRPPSEPSLDQPTN